MEAVLKKHLIAGKRNKGFVLATSMIFLLVFSILAVSVATKTNTNLQIADTHRKTDKALAAAQSGLEVIRYHLGNTTVDGAAQTSEVISNVRSKLSSDLSTNFDGVSTVSLNSQQQTSFSAEVSEFDSDTLQVRVTGRCGEVTRQVKANFDFGFELADTVFNYGVASRGPLSMTGSIDLDAVEIAVEASAYIKAEGWDTALSITGNSHIAGNVGITNPYAGVDLTGSSSIGGETGQDAIDNHVEFGIEEPEFPVPTPGDFEKYCENIIDDTTDTDSDATYENVKVVAGTNPTFSSNVTINGIMFVETSNTVTFQGNTTITGIIVGNGDVTDDSGTNQLSFSGNVESYPVSDLPSEFSELKQETGTFVLAPGFDVSFSGNFNTLNGTIAANGISFSGNAGGTIAGSIINYADTETTFTGNSDLYFNRSGIEELPAGFVPSGTVGLQYDPNSYSESIL